jgi:hypothetical protein
MTWKDSLEPTEGGVTPGSLLAAKLPWLSKGDSISACSNPFFALVIFQIRSHIFGPVGLRPQSSYLCIPAAGITDPYH